MEQEIYINSPSIKLGSLIKLANIVGSGGIVKMIVQDGLVKVNGDVCTMRGKKIVPNDIIEIDLEPDIHKINVLEEVE